MKKLKKMRKPNIKCYLLDKWHATKPYEICLHMFVLIILEVANRTYYANAKWLCTVAKKFCYGMYNVYPMYLCTAFKRRQGDVRSPLRSAVFPEGSMKNLMKAVAGHLPIPPGRSKVHR